MPDPTPKTVSDVEQALLDNAAGPAEATVDGESVKAHNLKDVIEAVKFNRSAAASSNPFKSIRIGAVKTGDAIGRRAT